MSNEVHTEKSQAAVSGDGVAISDVRLFLIDRIEVLVDSVAVRPIQIVDSDCGFSVKRLATAKADKSLLHLKQGFSVEFFGRNVEIFNLHTFNRCADLPWRHDTPEKEISLFELKSKRSNSYRKVASIYYLEVEDWAKSRLVDKQGHLQGKLNLDAILGKRLEPLKDGEWGCRNGAQGCYSLPVDIFRHVRGRIKRKRTFWQRLKAYFGF